MSSNTITKNDLKAILDNVLSPTEGGGTDTKYNLSINDHVISLTGSDATVDDVTVPDTKYSLSSVGNNMTLSGSDGSTVTVTNMDVEALKASKANVSDLNVAVGRIGALESDHVSTSDLSATNARIGTIESDYIDADYVDANYAHISNGVIDRATIGYASVDGLSANFAHIVDGVIDNATIDYADVNNLNAHYAHITDGVIDSAKIGYADVNGLSANYADIGLANVSNAWIENGVIKNGAISDAQIIGVSANKLTAGTIDASNINVANLRAKNLIVEKVNGQPILGGYELVDKNSAGYAQKNPRTEGWYEYTNGNFVATTDTTVNMSKAYYKDSTSVALYDQAYIDSLEGTLSDRIDDIIETFSGSEIPTLNNYPASSWTTDAEKILHINDIYYVVNAASQADGYCYRFSYDDTNHRFEWVLIRDSEVTDILERLLVDEENIDSLESFQTETSSWITETDDEISSLKTRTTNVETSLGNKVDTSVFNEVSQTVEENSASITSLSTSKADNSTVTTLSNTVNTISQTTDSNTSKISGLITTLGTNADGSTKDGDIVHKVTEVTQDLDGFKTEVSSTYQTLSDMENYSTTSQMNSAINQKAGEITTSVAATYSTKTYTDNAAATAQSNAISTASTDATNKANAAIEDATKKLSGQYATSSTSANTTAKVATIVPEISNWSLYTGASISVKFINENTAIAPTLNINSTGAKSIKNYSGSDLVESEYKWPAGATMSFVYDGTNWRIQDSTELSRLKTAETNITQNANQIQLKASQTDLNALTGRVSTAESTITQQGESIEAKVSKNGVITSINLSSEGITIDATKVDIAGAAVFNNYALKSEAVSNVVVEYALGNDSSTAPSSGWSSNTPVWTEGKYVWQRTGKTINGSTTYTYTCIQGAKGETGDTGPQGPQGNPGTSGTSYYTHIRYSENSSGDPMVTTPTSSTKYIGIYTGTSSSAPTSYTQYIWSKYMGDNGASPTVSKSGKTVTIVDAEGHAVTVTDGEDGQSIKGDDGEDAYFHIAWANSSDGTLDFSTSDATNKLYMGTYTDHNQPDSQTPGNYKWVKTKGEQGEAGEDGTSITIKSRSVKYQTNSSGTTIPTGVWSTTIPVVAQGNYLWTQTIVTYSDDSYTEAYSVSRNAVNGTNGSSVTVSSVEYAYQLSTSGTTVPSGTWSTTPVAPTTTQYAWTRTTTTYSDNSKSITYTVGGKTGAKGEDGAKGDKGDQGDSIKESKAIYYLKSNNTAPSAPTAEVTSTSTESGRWTLAVPTYIASYYYFVCAQTKLTNNSLIWSNVVLDNALTTANSNALGAVNKANSASYEEQLIYISKAAGTSMVSKNATWVSDVDGGQNTWTLKRPIYNSSYPVVFIAKQKRTVSQSSGTTCTCTTPIKDDTTTIIDGGHITTGVIDASVVTVTNLNANNITSGTIDANRLNVGDIISSGHIAVTSDIPTKVSELTNDSSFATTTQVSTAKSEAISTASADATSKANAAQTNAINTAAADATSKANAAEANAKDAIPSDLSELNNDLSISDFPNDSNYQTDTQVGTAISTATSDMATNTSVASTYAPKTSAVYEEQTIYRSKSSGSTPMAYTTWVTDTTGQQDTWTLKRPIYNSAYPVVFIAKQRKTVSGSITCSTPIIDDTTTSIDGGHITTGTIDTNRLNVSEIISTGSIAVTSNIPTKVSQLTNDNGYQNSTQVNTAITSKGYQTASQVDTAITSKGYQTASDVSSAITSEVANKSDKTDTISRTQIIYQRKTSSTAPSAYNTWLTTSGTGYDNWSVSIPQLTLNNVKYPYLFTAIQSQTISQRASGDTCTCTTPVRDNSTTVIDGGTIITGTVDASAITTGTISIGKLDTSTQNTITDAYNGVNNSLIYDHTYTISNGVATFVPHVYCKGVEVTTNYNKSCFTWKYRLDNNVTGTPTYTTLTTNNDRGCTVTISTLGYGGHVIGSFTPPA